MNVLFIIDHLDTGGAPVVVRRLCWAFSQLSVDVSLLVLSDRVSGELPVTTDVHTMPLTCRNWWEKLHRHKKHAKLLDDFFDKCGKRYDLVVSHLNLSHQVISRTSLDKEAWYCLHSDPYKELVGNKSGFDKLKKVMRVRRLYSGKKIVGVSGGVVESLRYKLLVKPEICRVLHNPIDLEKVREKAKADIEENFPKKYVVYVGRLEQRSKRFDRLLKAYQYSRLDMPLVIVGEGGDRGFIESEVKRLDLVDHVLMIGHRDNPYPYIKNASALVLSSDYEGFSLVLVEALACGTPVVSTNCPSGPREVLTGTLSNYLVPLDDGRQLGDALRRAVADPPHIPHDVVDEFDANRVAERYLSLAESSSRS